ncbi:tail fiber assembly protein [Citrobacter sp. wls828]|uniref:tail fiber assembly protein n=1 Tax=Citrobacter TaxID=544 RepID=UPI0010C98415|nr:tail fiber assembly protein [Citrobacter sp. FDAARGOS_156]MBJ9109965.1 tail fiber assembly protein [Citrobacter sp. FDAARGOS_156]TKU06294.1 tail fiber assembly protein [Citrobacter sp. wls828]
MAKATLNKYGIATKAGDITVFNYDGETREYLSSAVEFLAVGVGIPAYSCTDAPVEKKEGFAVCRTASLDGWEYITDHRGETVYDKQTGQPVELMAFGNYPDSVTTIAPSTLYDKWNGSTWVTDTDAKNDAARNDFEQKKRALRAIADAEMDWLQDAVDAGIATEEETTALTEWKKYRVMLMRVGPEKPDWPIPPGEQAS